MKKNGAPVAPTWVKLWLAFSAILVLYDGSYVLFRPRSMPGGDLAHVWRPYELYARVDKLYGRDAMLSGDGFNKAQTLMNMVEVFLHYLSLYLMSRPKSMHTGYLLTFASQLMTLWKTVLYWLNDLCRPEGQRYSEGSDMQTWLLVYILPNSFWLIMPTLVVWTLGKQIAESLKASKSKRA